jgi:hypothetical protein
MALSADRAGRGIGGFWHRQHLHEFTYFLFIHLINHASSAYLRRDRLSRGARIRRGAASKKAREGMRRGNDLRSVPADDLHFGNPWITASASDFATRLFDRLRLMLGPNPQVMLVPPSINRGWAAASAVDAAPKQLDDHVRRQRASTGEAVAVNAHPPTASYSGTRGKWVSAGKFLQAGV